MTPKKDEVITIAEKITDSILNKDRILKIIMLYYNLALLIGNDNEVMWASEELDGYKNYRDVPDYRRISSTSNKCVLVSDSCNKLESKLKDTNVKYYQYPTSASFENSNADKAYVVPDDLSDIVNILYNRVYKETINILSYLKFGGIIETIFEDTKKLVDSKLVDVCPDAIEKFTSTYERLKETNPESWAQAVTTCRRILKDFADAIYPPKDTPVNGRKVGEDEYINRLWAFASEKSKSDTNKELIQSEVEYIGRRIDSLYDLTCRGTHAEISKDEAERAVIRTYLLIGDLITLSDL